ncbi:plasmid replication protein RepC [Rhodobacter capsulatus]|uniref:plasmid replication protein RepC n=1 Tax=Rhodobacter capsulatus TaxID=1061 RepID=UPI004029428E
MAFIQATAAFGLRAPDLLSADNAPAARALPERHLLVETLRQAAPLLGLKPTVLATLEAMLSCLAPKRNHHMVFASNLTLSSRRNGVSDRTLRRHAAVLQEAGLLQRKDSANGKRFTRYDPDARQALHFGFDLSPLFDRLAEITALALRARQMSEQIAYLKSKIRAQLRVLLQADPTDARGLELLRRLRGKLTVEALSDLSQALPQAVHEAAEDRPEPPAPTQAPTQALSASDGQNVRHHQKSKKEITEEETTARENTGAEEALTLAELVTACPEAASFSLRRIESFADVVSHAQRLAPMIGIDQATYGQAVRSIGAVPSALTVWAMVQCHTQIRNIGAYFRAITSGARRQDFDAVRLVRRLGRRVAA